jgi:hypothetical protein
MIFNTLGIVGSNGGNDVVAHGITVDNLVEGLTFFTEDHHFSDIKSVSG